MEVELFSWLKNLTSYILEAKGKSSLSVNIGTSEDQFWVSGEKLTLTMDLFVLKTKLNPFQHQYQRRFDKNRLIIENGQFKMGEAN